MNHIMILLRKCLVAVLGGGLLIAGVAMLFLPGPAIVVIPAALAILAAEFLWARRWLDWLRERYKKLSARSPRLIANHERPEESQPLAAGLEGRAADREVLFSALMIRPPAAKGANTSEALRG